MNTQKQALKLKFGLIAFGFIFLAGCDYKSSYDPARLKEASQPQISYIIDSDALSYLNDYRRGSGLFALKFNENLSLASKNHAEYSVAHNHMGHDESSGLAKFTGSTPNERAKTAGYSSMHVLENIAYKSDFITSIDGLFSAIYHRFAFLNLSVNEVGFDAARGDKFSAYVFLMGNSGLNNFCKRGVSDNGSGKFYTNACANKDIKVKDSRLEGFLKSTKQHVKFPDKVPVMPYFSGEIPDPFPECKITANPVSIEFNESLKDIKFVNFEIYKGEEKLRNLKILDQKSDINRKFSSHQFAAFSREVFSFNTDYTAVFSYTEEGESKQIKWNFKTKTLKYPYFEASDGYVLSVKPDMIYEIFFRPKDCNDLLTSYSYNSSALLNSEVKQSGTNTLSVKLSGMEGDILTIKTSGGDKVKVRLSASSPKAQKERREHMIKSAFMIFGVMVVFIIIGIKQRR
ncbi:CAP domain-containing protein [Campylobacter sp. RM16192]|uniref:CAP domain-containing protein n=1 Tax=Campylobacter sp. RM16192 TaxID=1660080 RepID=UPI00145164CB|nr:CAP domain-containing protein [Campylobacter sp. RM16192]QCD53029.1 SCP-like extracellular protein [Campylobacter sp. RM16192]